MLGDREALESRLRRLDDAHVAPLTAFVRGLRVRTGPHAFIPHFDPWDGGVDAEVLFLLEAPGPKARDSGFVSMNNPDETAKNFFEACQVAKLDRMRIVIWNAVPWYIGTGARIRPARPTDIREGADSLGELLRLMPRLRAIALVGRKAQRVRSRLEHSHPDLELFACPHPSPMFVNRKPGNRAVLSNAFTDIRAFLDG